MVKGFAAAAAARIEAARAERAFDDVGDLAHRAALDRGLLKALSRAGALKVLAGNRHQASWGHTRCRGPIASAWEHFDARGDTVITPA